MRTSLFDLKEKDRLQIFFKLRQFDTAPVQVTPHKGMNTKRGVIHCSALDEITEAEIFEGLADEGVTEVRKIYFTRNGTKSCSSIVILTFDTLVLPKEIKLGYLNIKMDPYVPNPKMFSVFSLWSSQGQMQVQGHLC